MSEPKGCPFCGVSDLHFAKHDKGCFLRLSEEGCTGLGVLINAYGTRHTPEGYVLVPVEPTEAMMAAGHESISEDVSGSCGEFAGSSLGTAADAYKAMIAAELVEDK
jgi:hypothetical protein